MLGTSSYMIAPVKNKIGKIAKWRDAFAVLFSLFLALNAGAAPQVVKTITFDGVRTADPATLKQTISSREGGPYELENINADVRSLYQLGIFQDVRAEKIDDPDGVRLIYHVVEKPLVAKVEFRGNDKIKTSKLEEVSKVRLFSAFNEQQILDTESEIRKLYGEKGYYLAEVRHDLEPANTERNEWNLIFQLYEHEEVKIKRVAFAGNKVFSEKELRKIVRTKEKGMFSFINKSGRYSKETLEQDVIMLKQFYRTKGYLNIKVASPQVSLNQDKSELYVTYAISEGDQFTVSTVDVTGDILTSKPELFQFIKIKPKDIANERTVSEDLQRLTAFYGNRGYAFAVVSPQVIPTAEAKMASVTYQIQKGDRITIERIDVKGNTVTRDKVIRRELKIKENSIFNQEDLDTSRKKLEQLGYFEEVNFSLPRGSRDDTVIVNIEVKEKQTGSFSFGGGFSTAEKFVVTASVQKENFLGYGLSGNLSFELSARRQQLSFSFTDPYFLDTDWILSTSAFRRFYEFEDFKRASYGGSISFGRRFFDFFSFFLGYNVEDINLEDISSNVPARFDDTLGGLTSSASLTLNRDTRNNRMLPTKGTYVSNTLEYAGLGGDNRFFKSNSIVRAYYPVFKNMVLKGNANFGYVQSMNDEPVPLFERFFLGGVNSLRGYFPRSIGPQVRTTRNITASDQDFVFGGDKFVLFNVEFEVPIYDPAGIRAAIFFDTGNAFAEDERIDFLDFRSDVGAGLRWVSPFGPMRFEWGVPLNPKPGDDPLVFNFTVGTFF